ncbi:hypothetical protein GCM10017044_11820 [Kordiimonas sediminis]|uniref:YbjN domain-containing protein n=1 Tax=Kordiimonas sediminis TaxID=1735581 RepID=A0A919AQP7_9PROT|nr:YbjN domain-containing protein [Kordiimonas sediminis]GHF18911.1 hypothetical protein GCM10017044_11820 [Kordiimonas sediminis]
MTTLSTGLSAYTTPHPVDMAQELAGANDWAYERHNEDELTMFLSGHYADLQFRVFWRDDFKTLQFACLFDIKVPEGKRDEIYRVIGLINERMWIGHFEFWADDNAILFRHASLANDPMTGAFGEDHMATVVETAMGECERFFPVFQFVMWGGQSPEEAIESAMLECMGTA